MKKPLKKLLFLTVATLLGVVAKGLAFNRISVNSIDFAEVDRVLESIDGRPVYDFTQGEILAGSIKWVSIKKDSIISETFLGERRVYDVNNGVICLRSEETRDKFLSYCPTLRATGVSPDSAEFTAEGRYCKTEPIAEKGLFRTSAHEGTLIVTPGDTVRNVIVRSLAFDYRGAIGTDACERLKSDTLERYSKCISYFTLPNEIVPVAVIIKETVSSADGRDETSLTRYFADVQRSFHSDKDNKDESEAPREDSLGEFTVSFSNGMIEVTTTTVPRDALLAVMDKSGNIYYSRPVEADASVSISAAGLPFGQYIVSLSSASSGEIIKHLVFIK